MSPSQPIVRQDTFLHGKRRRFAAAPFEVRRWAAQQVGGSIDQVHDCTGGMSLGVAAVLTGASSRAFVKISDSLSNPHAHEMYRREMLLAARLPMHPTIPLLLGSDQITLDGVEWSVTAFEVADGDPPAHPWRGDQLGRVLEAWAGLQPVLQATVCDWGQFSDTSEYFRRWPQLADDPDPAWRSRVERWAERCAEFADRSSGDGNPVLAHTDLRADNIVLGRRVHFVDWAHPGPAAPWLDVLLLVLDAAGSGADRAQGGELDLRQLWTEHPLTSRWEHDLLVTGAAALAAGLRTSATRPVEGLPHRARWARAMSENLIAFAEADDAA